MSHTATPHYNKRRRTKMTKEQGPATTQLRQPPSLVAQQQQSQTLLCHKEEIQHSKVIRVNFGRILRKVRAIDGTGPQITRLQKSIRRWEQKDLPVKPGKRRLDLMVETLESLCSSEKEARKDLPCARFRTLALEIEEAKDILITANLRLVNSIARRYRDRGLALADLIQEGCIGLMRAVFRYDHNSGKRFATYASWWIRQAITRAIPEYTRTIKLPCHFIVSRNHFNKTFSGLHQRLGRKPTMSELSQDTYMDHTKLLSIIETSLEPISLDEPMGDNGQGLMGLLENDKAHLPDDIAITKDLRRQIEGILKTLNNREAQVLRLRFGLGGRRECTLDEVGKQFNVSRERIRQIEQEALKRLRHPSRCEHMRCFLEDN